MNKHVGKIMAAALLAAFFVLSTCVLTPELSVIVLINTVTPNTGSDYFDINYDIQNYGDTNLTGVQVLFGADLDGNHSYNDESDWTSGIDLNAGESLTSQTFTFWCYGDVNIASDVEVIGIGFDNPPD